VANTEQYVLVKNMQESDFQAKKETMGVASVMCLPIFRKAHEVHLPPPTYFLSREIRISLELLLRFPFSLPWVVVVMYLEHSSNNLFSTAYGISSPLLSLPLLLPSLLPLP
jgi:hypothetical protein